MYRIKPLENINIDLITDYLRVPSISEDEDELRLKEIKRNIYEGGEPKKYGPVAEAIVGFFYKKLNSNYTSNPGRQYYTDMFGQKIGMNPDGLLTDGPNKFWVEVKMRRYESGGTINEKITNVVRKYKPLTKKTGHKLILFLIADDEHKYNKEWSKLCRGEIEPLDEIDKNWLKADTAVLERIIYGTEIANILEENI